MNEDQTSGDCSFLRLSVHNDTPTIDIGSVWIAAYPLPWIVAVILLVADTYQKRKLRSRSDETAKTERGLSPALQSQPWRAPNTGWELLRIFAFLGPIAASFLLVDFCASCMKWRWVLSGLPATPPSLDRGGLFAGWVFMIAFCIASFPRDKMRALRSPMETLRKESWYCTHAAERTIVFLLVVWMAMWVLLEIVGLELGCILIWALTSKECVNDKVLSEYVDDLY